MTIFEELITANTNAVHNFSLGVLDAYFKLSECAENGRLETYPGILHLVISPKPKTFVFDYCPQMLEDIFKFQNLAPVYSLSKLPLEKESRFVEVVYSLKQVFDPQSYSNSKKQHQRIVYPIRWLEKNRVKIRMLQKDDLSAVEQLHSDWVKYKLDDEKTYKIMFPTARYLNCCKRALGISKVTQQLTFFDAAVELPKIDYRLYGAFLENVLVAIRVISVEKENAFDLAFFGNTWSTPFQLLNYINCWVLKDLFEKGIQVLNCGAGLSRNLKDFKMHYPSYKVMSYAYGQIKI